MSGQKSGKIDSASVERAVSFIERRHPVKTGISFEAETGISAETFRKWRDGSAKPGWVHATKMILIFGPEFLAATVESAPAWLSAAARRQLAEKLEAEIVERERKLAELRA